MNLAFELMKIVEILSANSQFTIAPDRKFYFLKKKKKKKKL